jgi:ABC-2 type transport system permease protein
MTALTTTRPRTASSPAGIARAIAAFVPLEVRRSLRNRRYLMFSIGFPVFFYLLFTSIGQGSVSAPFKATYLVSMAAYGAIGAALSAATIIALERSTGWARQLRVTPLPASAYVVSKLIVATVITVPAVILVGAAAQLVNHVALPGAAWVQLVLSLGLGAIPFAAMAILIGFVAEGESAQPLVMLVYFPMAILGGLWFPVSALPDGLATIGAMLPSSHLAGLGMAAIAGRAPDLADIANLAVWTAVVGALVAWRYRSSVKRPGG